MNIEGRAVVVGHDIDTDVIAPTEYLLGAEAGDEGMGLLKQHAFQAVQPDFYKSVSPGDILVAGRNFGLGSHREAANLVLPALGIQAVVADSIARIFFRNSIAIGMPAVSLPDITQHVSTGDQLRMSLIDGTLENLTTGEKLQFPPVSGPVWEILNSGGLIPLMKARLQNTMRVKIGTKE
ncbi:3-isopropylmalate dehydratase [Alicyclobacillus tolerans]|uniref:LeuD/DmdB family oxidoreductase small subunit n=1 Tax=Alicyclobacillus tolerans TaxID=90970 RepID=UPI001F283072|nr:3-isopropylmalate dehydratase [Alicyclobacillus tolerans]MCF8565516.1 3-isopropylmalate dehydratase [Alicyclobacillus tolerans]